MSPVPSDHAWPHPAFAENQKRVSEEVLRAHAGQHVAWSWDGSQIVAAALDEAALREKLRQAGIDSQSVVFDYIERAGEGNW